MTKPIFNKGEYLREIEERLLEIRGLGSEILEEFEDECCAGTGMVEAVKEHALEIQNVLNKISSGTKKHLGEIEEICKRDEPLGRFAKIVIVQQVRGIEKLFNKEGE